MNNQLGFTWPEGKCCAVSLTYDDALPVQRELVAPLLAERGLAATFYLNASPGFTEHAEAWRAVAALGHELGNHTLFHPGRREDLAAGVDPYNLCDYTVERWLEEMRIANVLLRLTDGQTERTFGNTYCQATLGRKPHEIDLAEPIRRLFIAGRGTYVERVITPAGLNYGSLGHLGGDRWAFDRIRYHIEQAAEAGGWVIFLFHGVGEGEGTHGWCIDTAEHARLVDYLAAERSRIWTTSVVQAARHLQSVGYAGTVNS
jgi:peptidoglycan/xylan/chitin deacetylase (PgdA/CDA1 family)